VPWSFSNFSPEFLSSGSEIWSRSVLTSWRKIGERKVSGRCARPRGKEWRRGGRLELIANGGDLDQQWRRGGLWHEQAGGILTRVLERESVREGGGL
jgi:hypothetical protein